MIAAGKMALRGLSQSVAKEYGKSGIHAVHLRMDCTYESARNQAVFTGVGMGEMYGKMAGGQKLADIDALAETYYAMYVQSPMGWTNEVRGYPSNSGPRATVRDVRSHVRRSGSLVCGRSTCARSRRTGHIKMREPWAPPSVATLCTTCTIRV